MIHSTVFEKIEIHLKIFLQDLSCLFASSHHIGVAKRGGRPSPIKIPPMMKNYDNIAQRCLAAVFFSNYAHNSNLKKILVKTRQPRGL